MTPPETLPERCDRCPATARVRAELPFGELHFCAHHARAHEVRLRTLGARLRTPANAPPLRPVPSRRGREPAVTGRRPSPPA